MGLCKCPKRRVTNQFCFEHRVNVCEYCMVTNHPKCVIQSYLQWLQDSDYNPICEICSKTLGEPECIRFTCYHVFHWRCADHYYGNVPRTVAPAGYVCFTCETPVFPPPNLVSPVADVLREKLAGVNWARAGLGLPLLSEDQEQNGASHQSHSSLEHSKYMYDVHGNRNDSQRGTPAGASDDESSMRANSGTPHSIVQMPDEPANIYEGSVMRGDGALGQAPRKAFKNLESKPISNFDSDDNKYKQKSTLAWITRWWRNSLPSSRTRRAGGVLRRYWAALAAAALLGLLLLALGRRAADDADPFGPPRDDDKRILQKN